MTILTYDFHACASVGFQHEFFVLDYRLAIVTINELGCGRKSGFENGEQNINGKIIGKRVQIMFTELCLRGSQN